MLKNKKNITIVLVLIGLILISYFYFKDLKLKKAANQTGESSTQEKQKNTEVIAKNLNIPWEVAFLPNNEILVTERPGNLLLVKNNQKIKIGGVEHIGEGGLLGLAVHPNFKDNHFIYLYLTTRTDSSLTNRVERYRLENNQLSNRTVIFQGILGASNHDGGRIVFGPDNYLYITTGDAENPNLAQDLELFNGKILRIKDDGNIPSDNPFSNAVYSYGHRNSQGLAFDDKGRLWATEHGRSGLQSGLDELNLIEKGRNYGWPIIQGDQTQGGMVSPIIQSGEDTIWAPSGAVFYDGSIFFGGLRGEALYEYKIAENLLKEHFKGQFGRIRAVVLSPDNYLYITTSNRDGRGIPKVDDDKLIKINHKIFR